MSSGWLRLSRSSSRLPALIRKFHEAKERGERTVTVWGSGRPRREFLHSDDMADACIRLLEVAEADLERRLPQGRPPLVNIGCGEDLTIAELAERVRETVASNAEIVYDDSKPDGTPQKLLDITLIRSLGWQLRIPLAAGLRSTYDGFLEEFGGRRL